MESYKQIGMSYQNYKKHKEKKIVTGLHILGEIYTAETKRLNSLKLTKKYISEIIKKSNLHELGSFYYKFPQGNGFTGLISLIESHIAIHTWPELYYFTLDVYLCNYSKDNSATCKRVFEEIVHFFKPTKVIKKMVIR